MFDSYFEDYSHQLFKMAYLLLEQRTATRRISNRGTRSDLGRVTRLKTRIRNGETSTLDNSKPAAESSGSKGIAATSTARMGRRNNAK